MSPVAFNAELANILTPTDAVASPKLFAATLMVPLVGVPETRPKVLSKVMEPGSGSVFVPIKPGAIDDPEDLAVKLIAELLLPAAILTSPKVMFPALLPLVVS